MELPSKNEVAGYLSLPWAIESGTLEDGIQFARCVEIPHAVAYAEPGEDLQHLFWDAMRSTLEAMIATGSRVPTPRAFGGVASEPARDFAVAAQLADDEERINPVELDKASWGLSSTPLDTALLQPAG